MQPPFLSQMIPRISGSVGRTNLLVMTRHDHLRLVRSCEQYLGQEPMIATQTLEFVCACVHLVVLASGNGHHTCLINLTLRLEPVLITTKWILSAKVEPARSKLQSNTFTGPNCLGQSDRTRVGARDGRGTRKPSCHFGEAHLELESPGSMRCKYS